MTSGFLCMASLHNGGSASLVLDANFTQPSADCYWIIEGSQESGYTIRNAKTLQYLIWQNEYTNTRYMGLSDAASDEMARWNFEDLSNAVAISNVGNPTHFFNLRSSQVSNGVYRVGTYSNSSSHGPNERYHIYDSEGNEIKWTNGTDPTPDPTPDPTEESWLEHSNLYYYVWQQSGNLLAIPQDFVSGYQMNGQQLTIDIKNADRTLSFPDVLSFGEQLPVELPTFTSYKFNNKFNYQVFTDVEALTPSDKEIHLSVAGIGKRLTASFTLPDEQTLVWVDDQLQESKRSRLRFDTPITYTIGRRNWRRLELRKHTDSSVHIVYKPFGQQTTVIVDWLTDHSLNAYDVPEIYINTENSQYITSKTTFVNATIEIKGGGVFPDMEQTNMLIKGRGNSSWGGGRTKDPYRLKFESGVKPLGMKKGKSWVLLSNKKGGSMTTNAIGHKIASLMGCDGQLHIVPVELYLNGRYQGSYNFCEKLGFSGNSIDLDDETYAGMVELDTYTDERIDRTNDYSIATKVHDPDVTEATYAGPLTFQGIIEDFNRMAHHVKLHDCSHANYINIHSAASYLATCDLAAHSELMHPKSVFMYSENVTDDFDPTGKDPTPWHCGPYWDCDWAFGFQQGSNYYQVCDTGDFFSNMIGSGAPKLFWNDLRYAVQDSDPDKAYYQCWHKFIEEGGLDELLEYCDDYYAFAATSLAHNPQGEFASDRSNYAQVTANSKKWLNTRAHHIYSTINAYELESKYIYGDINGDGQITLSDLSQLIEILLERQLDVYGTADANGDGKVDRLDVEYLLNQKLMIKEE